MKLDQRAAVEVTRGRDPLAALAAPPRLLVESDEPLAFDGFFVGEEIRVGRAGTLDNPDAAQKSDPAARSVIEPRKPMSR